MLENVKVNKDKYYKVGYSPYLKQYVMAITITRIVWYDRYYAISRTEYDWFDNDINKLNNLADELYLSGVTLPRFIFSEQNFENNSSQKKLIDRISQLNITPNAKNQEDIEALLILTSKMDTDGTLLKNSNLLYIRDKDGEFIRLYNDHGSIDISETSSIEELCNDFGSFDNLHIFVLNKENIGFLKNYSWSFSENKIFMVKIETKFSNICVRSNYNSFEIDINYANGKQQKIDTAEWQKDD